MSNEKKELDFVEWVNVIGKDDKTGKRTKKTVTKNLPYLISFSQKLTTICSNIKNRIDLIDEEYDLLRALHKFWYNGEYMIFKTKSQLTDEKVEQIGLFAENKPIIPAKDAEIGPHDDYAQ